MARGIRERHARSCRSRASGRCDCAPSFEAQVWNATKGAPVRRTFHVRAEAESWVRDAKIALRRGRQIRKGAPTLREAGALFLEQARSGVVRARGGYPYKPATIRAYEAALRLRLYDRLGDDPIDEISRADLQDVVDQLVANGDSGATIQTTVNVLRAIYRYEIGRDHVKVNPTRGLDLPSGGGRRERIADPEEAKALLDAVPEGDRAIWATAFYAGLRRGEMMALRDQAVDLEAGEIHVDFGWDLVEGQQPTKGREKRIVPIIQELRSILVAHRLRTGRRGADLLFGRTADSPFNPKKVQERADKAWKKTKLNRITPHECRHTFASIAIAAGVNIGTVSAAMGHASVTITWDRYHHLMPGTMDEAGDLIQAYLGRRTADGA